MPFLQTHHTLSWPTCSIYTRLSSDTWRECCQHWGVRARYRDRQSLTCILYSYHISFCMPASDVPCLFFQHVTPSPVPLQPPGAPHPGGSERLGSECTLLQHMVWHSVVSESGCRERQRLVCTIVCYYTSLCVPVLQIRHTRQDVTYCPLCIRACARRQCSRSHRRCSPPTTSNLFAQACSACDATDRV